ncbi:PucR family transcriptional regulator [Actinomycetospora chibensis]|uniref:PucR family transcriptional regulator n=1 Tax=Actinomycetospora chibensis TaxID=663606 RepID=A0ABV9RTH8_9PSEU|nr:helix-turn-helix domain-containing protein [Actinomycetospora chibensis]MDD7927277.1 helix-turn-helix domain-containing protein [Actinomycetospora chibensis]
MDARTDREVRTEVEAALAREYRFQEQLSQALITDLPEQGIADVLHGHLGLGVTVEDPFGRVLARAGAHGREPFPRLTRAQRDRLVDAARRVSGPLRARHQLASVAASHGIVLGLLVVLDPESSLEPSDGRTPESDARAGSHRAGALHAIGLATSALTLHLLHRRHLARTELRLRHDLVEMVLLEPAEDDLAAEIDRRVGRASALSHDLTGPHRVMALQPCDGRWPDGEAVGDLVERAARDLDMPYLGTLRGQIAILVCGTPSAWLDGGGNAMTPWSDRGDSGGRRGDDRAARRDSRSRAAWRVVYDAFIRVLRQAPALGVGGFVDRPEHLPRSYREAMQALTVRLRHDDPRGLVTFEDLGLYRLLATPQGRREAHAYVEDWLGALLAYDADRQADLVHTLESYLDHSGNYDDTAAALHIHRSTLRYRLQRIRELSGHDLAHADTRLNLHVAVRAAVVADPPGAGPSEHLTPQ